jgi:hypothetical protein
MFRLDVCFSCNEVGKCLCAQQQLSHDSAQANPIGSFSSSSSSSTVSGCSSETSTSYVHPMDTSLDTLRARYAKLKAWFLTFMSKRHKRELKRMMHEDPPYKRRRNEDLGEDMHSANAQGMSSTATSEEVAAQVPVGEVVPRTPPGVIAAVAGGGAYSRLPDDSLPTSPWLEDFLSIARMAEDDSDVGVANKKAVEELCHTTESDDGAVWCKDCEMWFNGLTQMEEHKLGNKHKKNGRRAKTAEPSSSGNKVGSSPGTVYSS